MRSYNFIKICFFLLTASSLVSCYIDKKNGTQTDTSTNQQSNTGGKCTSHKSPVSASSSTTSGAFNIVGGYDAVPNRYGFMAAVQRKGNTKQIMCGGSLIAKSLVLTAGHCVEGETENTIVVSMGRYNLAVQDAQTENFNIKKIIRHEQYSNGTGDSALRNDVALLVLDGESKQTPIKLNTNNSVPVANSVIQIIGWGAHSEKDTNYSGKLQEADIPTIENKACEQLITSTLGSTVKLNSYQMCAGFKEGGEDHCYGDSGGPLFSTYNGEFALIGIVSSAYGACAAKGLPGISTRVSYFTTWIKDHYPGFELETPAISKSVPVASQTTLLSSNSDSGDDCI